MPAAGGALCDAEQGVAVVAAGPRQGYAVSNGVVPCYDQYGSRGYCFFVYYNC